MERLLKVVETYRADTEEEVKSLVAELKSNENTEGYQLKSYSYEKKEKKRKGEIEDEGFLVKAAKEFGTFWED